MSTLPVTDTINGIERFKDSPVFGELVCQVVFLWKEPNPKAITVYNANAISGALKHGETVQVTQVKQGYRKRFWYYVESPANPLRPAQSGWVLAQFLTTLGAP